MGQQSRNAAHGGIGYSGGLQTNQINARYITATGCNQWLRWLVWASIRGGQRLKEREQIIDAIKSHYKSPVIAFQLSQRLYKLQPKISEQHQQALIDYYNLAHMKTKEKLSFIEKYLFGAFDPDDEGFDRDVKDTLTLYDDLIAELPIFQAILDKVLIGEKLSDAEIAKVMESTGYSSFTQQPIGERWMLMLLDDRKSAFLKAVYGVMVGISQRIVYLKHCKASDCSKIFIPEPRGREQLFCSDRCFKRTYTRERRKKIANKSNV